MSILLQMLKADKYTPPAVTSGIMAQKLAAAKEWLGPRWIGHPDYIFQEKHRIYKESNNGCCNCRNAGSATKNQSTSVGAEVPSAVNGLLSVLPDHIGPVGKPGKATAA